MNEMELQTTLDPIEMDMGDPVIEYSPVYPNPEGDPTDDLTKVQIQGNIYKVKDPEVHDWARAEEKPTYTKDEVGLGNVDDTSDMDKPVSTATQTALDNKVDKVAGKGLSEEDFTHTLKNKLDGIEAGAEVNTVNSVAGKTGNITLDKSDVGLGNVDNTSDMNKPVSTATQEALQGLASATQTALNGKVDNSTLNNYYTATQTDNLLNGKVDKDGDKVLSDNNYSDTDKTKLDGIEAEANKTVVDNSVTATSTNPVESKAIYNLLNDLLPEAEETGNPISISNASGFNAKALTVDMLPIQDLNGYDSPWVGGGGKNKFNEEIIYGDRYNGRFNPNTQNYWTCKDLIPVLPNTTYTFSGLKDNGQITFYDNEQNYLSNVSIGGTTTFTTPANAYYIGVYNVVASMGYNHQLELGSTATSYEPYENICPISGRNSLDITVNGKNLVFSKIEHCNISNGGLLQSYSSTQYDMHIAKVKANTTYTLKTNDNTFVGGFFTSVPEVGSTTYNEQRVVSTTTFTAPIDGYVAFRSEYGYSTAQLEVGSSATTYEPYKLIDTETITFGETVYGGTCDVVNGGTSVKYIKINAHTIIANYSTFNASKHLYHVTLTGSLNAITLNTATVKNPCNMACNILPFDFNWNEIQNFDGSTPCCGMYHNTAWDYTRLYLILPTTVTTRAEAENWLLNSGIEITYELATPTTLTTPAKTISLNKGNNTLSTSGDNMDLKYSTTISNPTSLTMARPTLSLGSPTVAEPTVEEPTEE